MPLGVKDLAARLFRRFTNKNTVASPAVHRARLGLTRLEDRTVPAGPGGGGTTATVTVAKIADATEGGATGLFRYTRTGDASQSITISVSYANGSTATAGSDYVALSSQVQFAAGSGTADVTVTPIDDTAVEPTESIVATITSGNGLTIGSPSSATMNLYDNDGTSPPPPPPPPPPPTIVFVTKVSDATEGGSSGMFRFERTGYVNQELTISYTVGGTATPGTDYTALSGTLTFPAYTSGNPGQPVSAVGVYVSAFADSLVDLDETVIVTIQSGSGYTVGSPFSATATIIDGSPLVSVSALGNATEGGANGTFRFTRTGSLSAPLTVTYLTGGSAAAGSDYAALGGTVVFATGSDTTDVTVAATDDAEVEETEDVTVYLEDGTNYRADVEEATVTIADNEAPVVSIASGQDAREGSSVGGFWLHRLGNLSAPLTVSISTGGTATPGTDFTALGTTVTFGAGEADAALGVQALTDHVLDPDETVSVTLLSGTGYQLGSATSATVSIQDATQIVSVYRFADAVEGGAIGSFRFVREGDLSDPLTVTFTTSGSATPGSDYQTFPSTIQFAPGKNITDLDVTAPTDGSDDEPTETVALSLVTGSYEFGSATNATVNIFNMLLQVTAGGPPTGSGNGLFARYYNNTDLTDVRTARVDEQVNFNWGTGAPPGTAVGTDLFAVRWTGKVQAQYSEDYKFSTLSDDGVRLSINGQSVFSNWTDHAPTTNESAPISLQAGGMYDITLEYYESRFSASVALSWSSPSTPKQVIPKSQLYSNTSTVGNFVWLDKNADGKQDAGEPGISGVRVRVLNASGANVVPAVTTTNGGGYFVTVPAGEQIKLSFAPGVSPLTRTLQGQGNDQIDSDIGAANETVLFNAPAAGQSDINKDAGFKGVLIDLDVTNNGSLGDPDDGIANYLPGYRGATPVLTTTADQAMQVIVMGLTPNATYKFSTQDTTKYAGIASNAVSNPANYPSSATDNDFVLVAGNGTVGDNTDVEIVADAQGTAKIGIRARDFGGVTTVVVKDAAGQAVATRKLIDDADGDGLADVWEKQMAARWVNQYGRPGMTDAAALALFSPNDDGELEDPDLYLTSRLVPQAEKGDAHTVLEEYRGYFLDGGGLDGAGQNGHAGGHIRLDPARKEILLEVDSAATLKDLPGSGTLAQKLKTILDGASKVFSNSERGAGIYMYYMFDEIALDLPKNNVDTSNKRGDVLKASRDTAQARASATSNLKSDFLHFIFVDEIGRTGNDGAVTKDFGVELDMRGSILAVTDLKSVQAPAGLDTNKFDELLMTTTAHEITHMLYYRPDLPDGAFNAAGHTIDPNGNGMDDAADEACLMYKITKRSGAEMATVKFFPVVQARLKVKSNQAVTPDPL